jgi:NADH-quinone oxidoreductase subunit L
VLDSNMTFSHQALSSALIWIAVLPLLGAAANLLVWPLLARMMRARVPRWVYVTTAVGTVAGACGIAVANVSGPLFKLWKAGHEGGDLVGGLYQNLYTWIEVGAFKVDLAFRLDTLSAVMVLVVTFVGALIHIYSAGYMKGDPRERTYFGYLNLFTGSMLILVLADNLLVMFIGWEGVGLCSYLLIGFWFEKEAYAYAGRKAFIVNRIGDFAFILGICLLFAATGEMSFQGLASAEAMQQYTTSFWGGERLALFGGLFLFIGAIGKSAQIPLYVWLPDAMAGPTPVSALIHAATMVTAGVYLIARLSFLYASSSTIMAIISMVGALTACAAAFMAFAQTDLKKVLAYSTVSQLGFMFCGVGLGAFVAGIFHLMTHAFFKAGLFLGAGSVMHAMSGSGDITQMGGLRKKLPITHLTFLIYCLAIAGFPFLAGFFSKDEILAGAWAATGGADSGWPMVGGAPIYGKIIWGLLTLAALGTAFYMFRLYCLVFLGSSRADAETQKHIHESPASMTLPLIVLAVLAALAGFLGLPHVDFLHLPNILERWLSPSLITGAGGAGGGEAVDLGHAGSGTIVVLMAVATVVAFIGMGLALALYSRGPSRWVERFTSSGVGRALHQASLNKLWVDEFYEKVIVNPFRMTARWFFGVIDRFLIDFLFVDGSAFVVDRVGRMMRWFQNGQVQRYLVAVVIGAVAIFFYATCGGADFTWEQTDADGVVKFSVDTGDGPGTEGAEIEWDFDGDGRVDSTEREPTWPFGRIGGTYQVTLRIKDGAFGSWRTVTHTVRAGEPRAEREEP